MIPAEPTDLHSTRSEIVWDNGIHIHQNSKRSIFIESGSVDVFGVPLENNQPRGAWVALGRLIAGDILPGPAGGPKHSLVLRPIQDAKAFIVEPLTDSSLSPKALQKGIQGALTRLIPPLSKSLPPQDFDALEIGDKYTISSRKPARPVDQNVWMRRISGTLEGHGAAAWSYSNDDWFFIRRTDWVTATSDEATVEVADTSTLLKSPFATSALAAHWTRFLYGVDRAVERTAQQRRRSIDDARERDGNSLAAIRDASDLIALETSGRNSHPADKTGFLTAVLRAYQGDGGTRNVPETLLPSLSRCTSFAELSAMGWVRLRMLRLEGDWWNQQLGPLVGTWGKERVPVALEPHDGGYIAWQADKTTPIRVTRENHTKLRRSAYALYAGVETGTGLSQLFRFGISQSRGDILRLLITTTLVGLVGTIAPLLTGSMLGRLAERGEQNLMILAGICLILTAVLAASLQLTQVLTLHRIRGAMGERTSTALWIHLLRIPVSFFDREAPGSLANVILGLRAAQEQLTATLSSLLPSFVVGTANMVILWILSPTLALPVVLAMMGCIALCIPSARKELRHRFDAFEVEKELKALSYSLLQTVPKLKAAGAQMRALSRFTSVQRRQVTHALKAQQASDTIAIITSTLPILALLSAVFTSSITHTLPPTSKLLSFLVALGLCSAALAQALRSFSLISPVVPQLHAVREVLAEAPETGPDQVQPGDLSGAVELSQVSFRYRNDGPLVLDGINFSVAPGEFVGIVGPSGSGKSTILRLILGFDRPSQGSVLLDGQDLSELDAAAVRRQFGIVMQHTDVMPGSIRDNIIASGEFTDAEIWEAAEMAGIAQDIKSMPMKLATRVNPGGDGLSGGQRQRILIARTLISKPRLILFDEATSALDNPTQERISHAMRLMNSTRIVVAHRLSTVRHTDRILVLDKGRLVEEGTYDELMALNGLFAAMAKEDER